MKHRARRSVGAFAAAAAMLAAIVVTANPAAAASPTWSGNGGPGWNTAASWSTGLTPVAGDLLTFPAAAVFNMNNDTAANTPYTLNFNGAGYILGGNSLSVGAIAQSVAGTNTIVAAIADPVTGTLGNTPVAIGPGGILKLGNVSGALGITKSGLGTLSVAAGSYTGGTVITAGQFLVNGTNTGGSTVIAGGLLGGSGATGPVTGTSGILSPGDGAGAGLLSVNGNLALNTGVQATFDINGAAAGTQFDQVGVTGTVQLNNATLAVTGSFVGANGSQYLIIVNQGAGAVVGTFAGLPEGQSFVGANGVSYKISYVGGTGNDVVLTQTGKGVTVLSGVDRVETAVNVSKNSFPAAGSANAVVLARGDLFPDALAGSPLAVAKGGPLLLTSLVASTGIDVRTTAEIQRVLSPGKTVYILGGEVAISASVATQLQGLGYTIVRLGGADRFDTAILIASTGLGNPTNILLATGLNFPDALAAGAAAAKVSGAVLLTNGTVQPPANVTYLSAHSTDVLFALGGPATVAVPTAQSISGVDRYDTAVKVAEKFFTSPTTVGLASGVNFPDGLTGGAHIGRHGGPLVLTDPNALPAFTSAYLTSVAATVTSAFVYGGVNAISTNVVNSFRVAIGA